MENPIEKAAKMVLAKPPLPPTAIITQMLDAADNTVDEAERETLEDLRQAFSVVEKWADKQPGHLAKITTIKRLRECLRLTANLKNELVGTLGMMATFCDDDELKTLSAETLEMTESLVRLCTYVPKYLVSDTRQAKAYRDMLRKNSDKILEQWQERLAEANGNDMAASLKMLSEILVRAAKEAAMEAMTSNGLPSEVMDEVTRMMDRIGQEDTPAGPGDSAKPDNPDGATPWDDAIKEAGG